eukprot:SAG11_NODE_19195_length_472_cov_0.806971_1_plen_131_part_01
MQWLASEKGPEPEHWNEDRYGLKEFGFQAAFRQDVTHSLGSCGPSASARRNGAAMSECMRLIPTLDIVLGCLMEAAAWAAEVSQYTLVANAELTIKHLVEVVVPRIYPFRADPVVFLLRFLKQYYHCSALT